MESLVKSNEVPIRILNDLLGGGDTKNLNTVDLSFDGAPGLSQEKIQSKTLGLGIEDTKSEWASLRSSLRPATGDWIQPKDELLEKLSAQEIVIKQEATITEIIEFDLKEHDKKELLNLLSEATSYLKEELNVVKSELSNVQLYKGAIQSLGAKIGDNGGNLGDISEKFDGTTWVIGQKLDDISGMQSVEGRSQVEELQESLVSLIKGQKKILESISDVLGSLKTVPLGASNFPRHENLEQIAEKQEEKIDSVKLEILESRIEDGGEDRFLKRALIGLGAICLLTFGAIVYSILV